MKITRNDKFILEQLHKGLNIKKIAQRRKVSVQAIYKAIKKLERMNIISREVVKGQGYNARGVSDFKPISKNIIRLHGIELNIKIIYGSNKYLRMRKEGKFQIDNNLIKLYNHSIEIYIHRSFYGINPTDSLDKAMIYLNRFLRQLEKRFQIILIKPEHQNIRWVNAHYSEINNEIAIQCHYNKEKLKILTSKEGQLWAQIDDSLHFKEFETMHPDSSYRDMQIVADYFNNLRDNWDNVIMPIELQKMVVELAKYQSKTSEFIKQFSQLSENNENYKIPEEKPFYIG